MSVFCDAVVYGQNVILPMITISKYSIKRGSMLLLLELVSVELFFYKIFRRQNTETNNCYK